MTVKGTAIGTTHYSIAAGKTETLKLKLTSVGRKLLKKGHGKLKATLKLRPTNAGGKVVSKSVTLSTGRR